MALPSRFMELSPRVCPRLASQLPLFIRHSTRGGLLVSRGDCRRQDKLGVPLGIRFLASAVNSASPASARPQYFPVTAGTAGCHMQHPSSAGKGMLLHKSGRAQGHRLFNNKASAYTSIPAVAKIVPPSFATAVNKHKRGVESNSPKTILEALEIFKVLAKDKYYCENEFKATDILDTVMSPLGRNRLHKRGGGLDDGVVKESLEVARLLLDSAPEEIRVQLCKEVELEPILDRIVQDYADHEVLVKLAKEIQFNFLAKLPPSTPK
ncbi:unnamed protein product [Urochloa humidicola]